MGTALRPEELSKPCAAAPWDQAGALPSRRPPDWGEGAAGGWRPRWRPFTADTPDRGLTSREWGEPQTARLLFSGASWACGGLLPCGRLDRNGPKTGRDSGSLLGAGASWAALS